MIEQPAVRLADTVSDATSGRGVDERACWAPVIGDDAQRLFDRVDHFDSTDHDATEGVSAFGPSPTLAAAYAATGDSAAEFSEYRTNGPVR